MRVLVIGAGHNGLVAAIQLAQARADVTVLEHSAAPGGATTSVTRSGFVHDHCAAFVPMTVASPAMRELELERDGLEWVNPAVVITHPFLDGSAIALHRDVEDTVRSLGAAGAGWERGDRPDAAARRSARRRGPVVRCRRFAHPCGWRSGCGATASSGSGGSPAPPRRSAWTCSTETVAPPPGWPARRSIPACRPRPRPAAPSASSCSCWGTATAGRSRAAGMQALTDALVRRAVREGATIACEQSVADPRPRRSRGRRAARRRSDASRRRDREHRHRRAAGTPAPRWRAARPRPPAAAHLALRHRAVQGRLRARRPGRRGRPPKPRVRRSSTSPASSRS